MNQQLEIYLSFQDNIRIKNQNFTYHFSKFIAGKSLTSYLVKTLAEAESFSSCLRMENRESKFKDLKLGESNPSRTPFSL
jgi:hypothetical protein